MNNVKRIYYELKELWRKISKNIDWTYCSMIFLVIVGYVLVHDLIGETFLEHNAWDSYTLQAKAWLDGKVSLGKNYNYLELAIYKDDWYVSFPPFPSVAMLPWVMLYGLETPNNMIMIIYIMVALTLVYCIARYFKMREVIAAFWSVFVVFGCNMLWMSTMGSVWFQAQLLNMILCLGAILAILNNKRVISYICIALAVGCRPFSIVYFFVLLVYYYNIDRKDSKNKYSNVIVTLLRQWVGLISAAIIGVIYMIYNYVRFDNPLEFGHNYLPEFIESPNGQFNVKYVIFNLYRVFIRPLRIKENMGLDFDKFDGFCVFIANPIFIIFFVCIIANIISKNNSIVDITIILMILANIICLCMHKTLGGWQFGNRYLVDTIPFIMLYILNTKKSMRKINKIAHWERAVAGFALLFNMYGIMFIFLDQLRAIQ